MQSYIRLALLPFLILAGAGFALSAAAHVAALAGRTLIPGESVFTLHVGVFVVWLPTVLLAQRMTRASNRRAFWRVALSGCPDWMRIGLYVLFAYAAINFVIFMLNAPGQSMAGDPPPGVVRGFSGHWMVFYYAAFAVMFSAFRSPDLLQSKRCPNGHVVGHDATYCEKCGAAVREIEATGGMRAER